MEVYKSITTTVRSKETTVEIRSWEPYVPAIQKGPPENYYPAEGGEGDWVLLDEEGNEDNKLMASLTNSEIYDIDEVCFTEMEIKSNEN